LRGGKNNYLGLAAAAIADDTVGCKLV